MTTKQKMERLAELEMIFSSLQAQPAKSEKPERWVWVFGKRTASLLVIQKGEIT